VKLVALLLVVAGVAACLCWVPRGPQRPCARYRLAASSKACVGGAPIVCADDDVDGGP
jgi:hypothetical protein